MRLVRVGGVGLAILLLVGCGNKKDPNAPQQGAQGANRAMPVEVLAVQPGEVKETQEYLGQLISRQSVVIRPQVTGNIKDILARPGEQVRQGQVLLVVDPRQVRAGLHVAEAQHASSVANREYAQRTRERASQLLKEGLMSRQDYDQAVAQAASADASAQAAEAQTRAQAVQVEFYEVSAPFDGVLGNIPVKVGDYVTPETVLTNIDQSRVLEASVQIPVESTSRIQVGRTVVELLNDQGEPVVDAPIYFMAPTPFGNTQLVELRSVFENKVGLRAGQFVRARVIYAIRQSLLIPIASVTQLGSQAFVFTVGQGDGGGSVAQRQPVTLGPVQGNSYEVVKGLNAGTQVIVSSVQLLREGQPVEPKPAKPQGPQQGVGGASDAGQGGASDAGQGGAPDAGQ